MNPPPFSQKKSRSPNLAAAGPGHELTGVSLTPRFGLEGGRDIDVGILFNWLYRRIYRLYSGNSGNQRLRNPFRERNSRRWSHIFKKVCVSRRRLSMLSLSVTFLLDYGLAAEYCSGFPKCEIRIFEQKSCQVFGRKSN